MKIAPYWVRESRRVAGMLFRLRAWSFSSVEDARGKLEEKARLLEEFHRAPFSSERLEGLRRALRRVEGEGEGYAAVMMETVLERLDEANVVTRNRYGVEVLNSSNVCFADVDEVPSGLADKLLSLLGRGRSREERLLEVVQSLCREDGGLGVRVYRTARGWRLLLKGKGIAPQSAREAELFRRLHVDALYARLCRKQGCWRARLTPKPFRLGMPSVCPALSSSEACPEGFREWLALYEQMREGVAVCRLVATVGVPVQGAVVAFHDERTGALLPEGRLG